jgi:type II secretory pathway component PulJ
MNKKLLSSEKGLTLVELLLALSLIGVVSVLIIGVLVSGMNSYRSVNKQISLHDEANAIMTKLSREIFVATSVESLPKDPNRNPKDPVKKIEIEQYDSTKFLFEFTADGEATRDEVAINSSMVEVSDESSFTVNKEKATVSIQLKIKEKGNDKNVFQLTEEVSYVNVQQGEGG